MNNTTQEPELPSKEHLFEESCLIIDEAQHEAYHAVNIALLKRNWLLGKRLNETINSGQDSCENIVSTTCCEVWQRIWREESLPLYVVPSLI